MKKLLVLILFILGFSIYANDTAVEGAGGALHITTTDPGISIENEIITIMLYPRYYHISVRYDFLNHGDRKVLETGFPEYKYGTGTTTKIRDFSMIYDNGEIIPAEYIPSSQKIKYMTVLGWYKKNIEFEEKIITTVQLEYEADYGIYGFFESVEYLVGTGRTWADPIKSLTVRVINNSGKWIRDLDIEKVPYDYLYISNGIYEVTLKDYEPELEDLINLTLSNTPLYEFGIGGYWGYPNDYFSLKDEKVSDKSLRFRDRNQLRIMRNAIFAFRGYTFKSQYLQDFFEKSDWYQPNPEFSETVFTDQEKYNINFIRDYESELSR
ncbi:YARHG domain-containing protein [Spirochaeta isovalerica]|uniref:YARHG domain-containing protein n=1 Tax=Spirochaeta isovalerica TaxID=150 RepID=A0A841RGR1_9SPIO|nr:YARHG domain-containing protein [Spirochaeta isovalerica]MBB6481512.1 hypothetical protein [Spirochaeta isovalerica]